MHPARRASGAERVKYFLVINNFVEQSYNLVSDVLSDFICSE
jgi:hypothetical protein